MFTKKETIESVSENIVGCQSQHFKQIKAEDTGRPPKIQIPPNLQSNPSSEIEQNDIVVTAKILLHE